MCGIIAALAQRNVTPILLEGLHRMEYRGYDSAGIAVLGEGQIDRARAKGKVSVLEEALNKHPLNSHIGIGHTRWATHGEPSEANAHPHNSNEQFSLVHNGIIENYAELRDELTAQGYEFLSQTDTEVIVHLVHREVQRAGDFLQGVRNAVTYLRGAYAVAIINVEQPGRLVAVRRGSPLLLGVGIGEHFLASDTAALIPVTQRFVYLKDGDLVDIQGDKYQIEDEDGEIVVREIQESKLSLSAVDKGPYKHFMLKEIYEQPTSVRHTLRGRVEGSRLLMNSIGKLSAEMLAKVKNIHFVACGTSYHAAFVARYWIEQMTDICCSVEVASEYRYRQVRVPQDTLYVTISQSGETADSLAAMEEAIGGGQYLATLAICNVAESTMTRVADASLLTFAGPEIGVASTKAFTTQLVALQLLTLAIRKAKGASEADLAPFVEALQQTPDLIQEVLGLYSRIEEMAEDFVEKSDTIFLGRGPYYPVALEGALKLKEISYIHAEGYPAGELKHGPLALIDSDTPVVAVAPNDNLLEKLKSNLEEVRTRGGRLYVIAEEGGDIPPTEGMKLVRMNHCPESVAPIVFTVPLQLLSYHVAVMRGTDVDQPRNLAKSVTVE
jgi:glucosamine--fructose-6-phosphate aminotransferase (isomerizing)